VMDFLNQTYGQDPDMVERTKSLLSPLLESAAAITTIRRLPDSWWEDRMIPPEVYLPLRDHVKTYSIALNARSAGQ